VGASSIVLGSPGLSLSAGGAPTNRQEPLVSRRRRRAMMGVQHKSAHRTGRPCSCSSWCLGPGSVRSMSLPVTLASCSVCFCPRRVPGMAHANAPGPGLTSPAAAYRSSYSIRRGPFFHHVRHHRAQLLASRGPRRITTLLK
jgi:hypothetical protein